MSALGPAPLIHSAARIGLSSVHHTQVSDVDVELSPANYQ